MDFDLRRIKAERIASGITQTKMAQRLGMSRSSYWKREAGTVPIDVKEFASILTVIGIDRDQISIFFKP
ncbi:helix-turn-helix domain-containing protein [Levilactobacillus brevis]|uniref:Helix-turn-helix domain-containing protein n=1 Tax=Levilactobacillus hammesii TaxID=267633 RepID=A0A921F0W7_9LACO|nr:helix-turn-helix domain-containing protein [Levilactobacillus brevis]HJE87376.1 helix-turn-helix domain-containing protein [Levilactobacillus hammesii]